MKTLLRWLLGCVALLALLLVGPAWMLASGTIAIDVHWSSLDRSSAGLAPTPESSSEAVVQVYAANAYNWRGAFGVHPWIAIKEEGESNYRILQVMSWRRPTVVAAIDTPDRAWFGNAPMLLADYRGDVASALIPEIIAATKRYPSAERYRVWPGPNSNTFIAWIAREVEGFSVALPATAVGKDFLFDGVFAPTPSGTGYQLSLGGVVGFLLAKEEGIEINLLGLSFGVDVMRPALKLPGIGRLGMPARVLGS
ncbi:MULTISPECIES: DUF3750 domain-containing protein [unclassified Halomonas]|uniref:DUF3750 domain-containing protein n=1 Tax=unclassified Halomonas TaxID=2609666 RepID=UPI0009904C73|nr:MULTISPECIES: DUF3750 domain-containing protein [unclassified Halomonas]AQU82268.1 hypothetical protein B2G49_06445 [Halomonas sp. 'Soap Lake \